MTISSAICRQEQGSFSLSSVSRERELIARVRVGSSYRNLFSMAALSQLIFPSGWMLFLGTRLLYFPLFMRSSVLFFSCLKYKQTQQLQICIHLERVPLTTYEWCTGPKFLNFPVSPEVLNFCCGACARLCTSVRDK